MVERGAPQADCKTPTAGLSDWTAARVFLKVARCASFRSAAERVGRSINVLRRRIDDCERQTAARLRDVHGAGLTEEGAKYLETRDAPRNLEEMRRHRLAPQDADESAATEAFASAFPGHAHLRRSSDIWLSYHPTSGRIPRVRQMIDWLIETFNPASVVQG